MAILKMTPPLLVLGSTLLGLVLPGESGSFLRATKTSEEDVEASLASELANTVDKGRLSELEGALRPTFAILPKNARGNLGHKAVRYVLHRLFVQRHGWYIKGLEPNSDVVAPPNASSKEWVPSYLQERLEQRLGDRGAGLRELAAAAAAIEDLVREEAVERLQLAYEIHGLPSDGTITGDQLDSVIKTYYVSFLLANNFSATGPTNAEAKEQRFASTYTGWSEAEDWLQETLAGARVPGQDGSFDFPTAARMALKIGEEYHAFNDLECKSLKHTMQQIEGWKPGRVRLSAFYNKGLYSHWRFTEKPEYLRTLGALDESDVSQQQVILPNYLMARTNCLEASDLYALCCQNECEGLMGHLEQEIGAPGVDIDRLSELVAALPSATVAAPRSLSAALLGRLAQVAESHGGVVRLHSRLFAQWMHHAYPRECPYPHEAGTTSPQTPDEWMRETGHSSTTASKEEMMKQVESDTCSTGVAGCGGEGETDSELPWSETEELLTSQPFAVPQARQVDSPNEGGMNTVTLVLLVISAALALVVALDYCLSSQQSTGLFDTNNAATASLKHVGVNLRAVLACISLGTAASALDLLDKTVLMLSLLAGLVVLTLRVSALGAPRAPQPKDAKSYV